MSDPASTEPRRFLTIETSSFVPLVLAEAPETTKQADGRIVVNVALAKEHVQRLEDFTRAHLGGRVAMVFDEEVVSVHKIRSPIEGGRMQIMRCTDRACERILSKLVERRDAG